MTKLTQERLNTLTNTADESFMLRHIFPCNYQQISFLSQGFNSFISTISLITKHNTAISRKTQSSSSISIMAIARSQNSTNNVSIDIDDSVKLESEKPPFRSFAKICASFSKIANAPMAYWLTYRDRLAVDQIKRL